MRTLTRHNCFFRQLRPPLRLLLSRRSLASHLRAISNKDMDVFRNLTDNRVLPAKDANLETDWTKHWTSQSSSFVLEPKTVSQVSEIVKYCAKERIGIVPVAGNTGLVGGSMPQSDREILLSTRKLNSIYSLDGHSGVLRTQAGVILQDLQEYAERQDYLVPIDLGSRGSCCIGGNVGTNAGGQYFYRYGSIASNLLGLQVVTGDGQILDLNFEHPNIKDNTGYKIHQVFVGSEGTLGIITGVSLLCRPLLHSRQTALLACESFDKVLATMQMAKRQLGETLAAFEWMDRNIVSLVGHDHKIPLQPGENNDVDNDYYPHYLLVETHGSNTEHDQTKMETFLEYSCNNDAVVNGLLAQDLQQSENFWKVRESSNPAAAHAGWTYKYDVSLPGSNFADFIATMQERLAGLDVINTNWGHVLDGNLHFNVTKVGKFSEDEKILHTLEPFVFETVHHFHGSISAEHGIGQSKNRYMSMIHNESVLQMMRSMKQVFDPAGIFNPGKVLPS